MEGREIRNNKLEILEQEQRWSVSVMIVEVKNWG